MTLHMLDSAGKRQYRRAWHPVRDFTRWYRVAQQHGSPGLLIAGWITVAGLIVWGMVK